MLSTKIKILIARIIQSCVCIFYSNTKNISVLRKGIKGNLDLNEGIDFSIFLLGYFEMDTFIALERLINKGDTIIDIGANIGAHTLHMAQKVSNGGKVYAIEQIDKVDLIKLDVDGNELEVLAGGKEVIKKYSPTFVMEFGPDQYEIKKNFDEAVNLLGNMGYKFFSLNEKIQYPSDVSLIRKIIPKNGSINIVARKN